MRHGLPEVTLLVMSSEQWVVLVVVCLAVARLLKAGFDCVAGPTDRKGDAAPEGRDGGEW